MRCTECLLVRCVIAFSEIRQFPVAMVYGRQVEMEVEAMCSRRKDTDDPG